MQLPVIVIHERRAIWARQLRPRLADRPIRWRESRNAASLLSAVRAVPCPIVVLDLGRHVRSGLEDLTRAWIEAPSALFLVLNPEAQPEIHRLARECGATYVWSGFAPPPRVVALLDRWLPLARHRTDQAGRPISPATEADPDDPLALLDFSSEVI